MLMTIYEMASNKNSSTLLYPEVTIDRRPPINLFKISETDFFKNVKLVLPKVQLHTYSNVCVTPEGIVFKGLSLAENLLIYPNHKKTYNKIYLASSIIKRKRVVLPNSETYLLCFDYWSNSIFHWMCDALPRIESVKKMAEQLVLLLPKYYEYAYIHETLKAYKFKSIYLIDSNTYLNCSNLIVPEQITTSGQIRPDNILSVRKTLLEYFMPKFTSKVQHHNIYISRSKARFRKVLNETELLPLLKAYNYEIIFFEDLSVLEQIELCYNAKNIVSIHGANLTNIIFLQANSNVLEFRKKDDQDNNYYYELTDSIGCNYYYLNCDFEDPKPDTNTFSLWVDAKKLEAYLKLLNE